MSNGVDVTGVTDASLVLATSVYPSPTLSMLSVLNVAMPPDGVTPVEVTDAGESDPPDGFAPIASLTLSLKLVANEPPEYTPTCTGAPLGLPASLVMLAAASAVAGWVMNRSSRQLD